MKIMSVFTIIGIYRSPNDIVALIGLESYLNNISKSIFNYNVFRNDRDSTFL
jgi:hypothetical protein